MNAHTLTNAKKQVRQMEKSDEGKQGKAKMSAAGRGVG
jgi:hypothetical protein